MLRDPKARQRLLQLGTSGAKAHLYRDKEKGDEDEAIANWEQKKEEGLLEQPSISDSARNIDMQKFSNSSDPRLSNNRIYAENSRTMGNYNPQADKELTGYERFMGYKDKYTQRKEDEEALRKQAKKDADYSAYKNEKASALENMNQEQYEALKRYNDRVDFWKARGGAMPTGDRLAEEKQAAIDAGIPEDKVEKYAQYVKEKDNERETNKRNEWVKERLTDDTELNGGVSDALKGMGRLGAGYLASQHPFLGAAANYGLDQLKDKTLTRGDVANMVATPLDILASPVVGMAATETVNKLNYADKRAHVDTNSRAYALQNLSNTIEQTQKENIADTVNNQNWSDTSKNVVTLAAQGAYDLGMTTSKAALSMAIGQVAGMGVAEGIKDTEVAADIIKKVANIITLPSYGTSSYAQTLKEGYDRGLSEGEAQATAFVAGCAEMLTEVFSLDMALDAMNKGGRKLLKEKIVDALAGASVEGSEEFFNDIINGFADTIINGDKSEYNVEVEELMKQGLSKEDAQKEATINFFKNGAKDFAMGMASGLILQGGASLLGSANTMDEVRMLHQEGNYREIEEGIDTDPNSYADENQVKVAEKAKEMYKKLADKAERGETIKNSEQQSAYELLEETMGYAQQNLTTETQNLENGENMTPQEVENNNTQNIETNEQNITQTARALREAETPQELVKAEREAKAAGFDAGQVAKEVGRVSQQKGFDIEEVRQLEAVPTAEEAKQLGYEGKEAPENLDLAGKKAYNEGKAQALKEVQNAKIEKPLNQAKATLDGEKITIKGLTKNNEFITDKGNIPANKVTFNDKTTEYLYQSALKYEGNVRDAFIEKYSPKITAGAYVTAFESLYNAGSLNKKWGAYAKRHSFLVEQLGEDAARTIYDFAMMENIESRIKNRGKKNAKMSSGSVKDLRENVPESGDALFETAEILAKKLGIDIVLGADTGKANGEFNGNNIFVKDGTGVELRTLYHEMGEFIKAYEKQGFDDLRSSIIEWFNKYDENGFDALVKNYYETYKAHYEMLNEKYGTDRSITMGEASDEAIFDALVNICLDEKVADNFIEWAYDTKGVEAEGFVERFKQFISDFFEHLRNLIADQSFKQHGEFIANMASVEELTDIQNKVLNAIDNAAKNYRQEAYNNTKAQTEDAGVAASFSVEVGKDGIERYTTSERTKKLTNKERQKELQRLIEEEYVGRTAKFIRNGHAYYATLDRKGMNKNIYGDKKSDSKGYKAKMRIGADGDIFELAENARYTGSSPEHKAKQGGAHRNNQTWDYFEKYIESDGVGFDVLINVRKNNDGEFVYGIELKENKSRMPGRQKSPSVTGIQLNKNIPSSTENSKLSLEVDTEGNKLSEGQKKYFKDSKVVDENGALKVMYHGTDAEFNVFNPSKSDDGLSMFFTDDENIAKGYGNTSKVYINVENPLHVYAENADDFTWQEALGYGLSENEKEEYFNLKNRIDSLENGDEKYALEEKLQNRFYDNLGNKTTKEWSAKAKAEGYDGVIFHDIIDSASEDYYEPSNVVVVFDSNQVKRVDNQNPNDNADIRYSFDVPELTDENYMAAVESGDMETAQAMVNQKAKEWGAYLVDEETADSKFFAQDLGKAREFYHGTRRNDFTEFDIKHIGAGSGDIGFFGKGFYFAFGEEEAKFYGNNIISAYLKLQNPYIYENLYSYNGENNRYTLNDANDMVWIVNMQEQFPKLVKDLSVIVYDKTDEPYKLSYKEFVEKVKDIEKNVDFEVEEEDGTWVVRAGKHEETDTLYNGKVVKWEEYDYEEYYSDEKYAKNKANQIYGYLNKAMYNDLLIKEPASVIQELDFSNALKQKGYDGVLQSKTGDEAVVFESSQIKKSDPVTYDDNGNVIPLSQRFSEDNQDIRYSLDLPNYSEEVDDLLFGEELSPMLKQGAELLKDQEVDRVSVERVAKDIIKQTSSEYDPKKLADNLEKVFAYMQSQGEVSYNDLSNIMVEVARPVVEESRMVDPEEQRRYEEFVGYLKSLSGVRLSEKQKEEVRNVYGTYGNFRNKFFGKLNISDKASTTLDQIWSELVDMSGGVLELDAAEGDQPTALLETLEALKPSMITPFLGNNNEAAYDLALRIVYNYYDYIEKDIENSKPIEEYKKILRDRALEYRQSVRDRYEERYKEEVAKVKKSKKRVSDAILKERARVRDVKKKQAEKQEASHQREQIRKTANLLFNMLEKPTDKRHIPDALRTPITQFLASIDFVSPRAKVDSSTRLKWQDMMRKLQTDLESIKNTGKLGNDEDTQIKNMVSNLDPALATNISNFIYENRNVVKLSTLKADKLKELSDIISSLKSAVVNSNAMIGMDEDVEKIGQDSLSEIGKLKERNDEVTRFDKINQRIGIIRDYKDLSFINSFTYFHRLGPTAEKILDQIREGYNTRIWRIKEAQDWFESMLEEEKLTQKDIEKWGGNKADKFKFKTRDGEIELTTGQLMELYAHSRRKQSRGHIEGGGIINGISMSNDMAHHISPATFNEMMSKLTDQQKRVAEKMQDYLSHTVSEWGNNATKKAYNYSKFTEDFYWPIKTETDSKPANSGQFSQEVSLHSIENMGAAKNLMEGSNNALYLYDAISTFSKHVADMATYEGLMIPIQNALKWYNYSEKVEIPGVENERYDYNVKSAIKRSMGKAGQEYFLKFIKDLNGVNNQETSKIGKFMGNAKAAAVGANLRVVVQQPTAIARAMSEMDSKYLIQAQSLNPMTIIEYSKKAQQNSALALWKHWGYFDSYLGQTLEQVITGRATMMEKVQDKLSWGAQTADDLTWGILYRAAELEIKDTTDIKEGTAEFDKAVAKRFEYVADRTQVVDTPFHRTEFLRSKSEIDKMLGAFMMEPMTSYNMLYRASQKDENGKINVEKLGKAAIAYIISNVLTSAASSLVDALRADDDETPFAERYLAAFIGYEGDETTLKSVMGSNLVGNLNPLNMIPILKEFVNAMQGFEASRMDVSWIYDTVTAGQELWKLARGETKKTPIGAIEQTLKAIGNVSGFPAYQLWREFKTFVNNLNNIPALKEKGFKNIATRQPGKNDDLKYSVKHGIGIDEAVQKKFDEAIGNLDPNSKYYEREVKKAQEDARNNIGTTLTNTYKQDYVELATDPESKEFKELDTNIREALKAAGFEDEAIEERLNLWLNPKEDTTYLKWDLMDAVESGNGIKEAVVALVEAGKDKGDINSVLTDEYREHFNELSKSTDDSSKAELKSLKKGLEEAWKEAGYEEDEIVDKLSIWSYGDGKSTTVYQPLYDTFENGGDVQAEVKKLMDSGKEKSQVASAITSHYKEKLIETRDPNLKSQLIKAYMAAGYTNSDAKKKIDKWFEPKK